MQPKEMETPQEIASLIARRILGDKLTDEENAQLDQWLETSTQNQQTYQNVEETDLVEHAFSAFAECRDCFSPFSVSHS